MSIKLLQYKGNAPVELEGQHVGQWALQLENQMMELTSARDRSTSFRLPPATYCVITYLYNPGAEGEYMLRLATQKVAEAGWVHLNSFTICHFAKFNKKICKF